MTLHLLIKYNSFDFLKVINIKQEYLKLRNEQIILKTFTNHL